MAQVDGDAVQLDGVQVVADAVAGLEDHALDAGVGERVGDRQPGDTGADHHDSVHRPGNSAGDGARAVVELTRRHRTPPPGRKSHILPSVGT